MSTESYLAKAFARALLDPAVTIVIGQCRVDQPERLKRRQTAFSTVYALSLRPIFCVETLKGRGKLPDLIFVDSGPLIGGSYDKRDPKQMAQFTNDDGMRVLGLTPLSKFQAPPRRPFKGMRLEGVTDAELASLAPQELFRRLKAGKDLNEKTVFTVAPAGLARRIDLPPPKMTPLEDQTPDEARRAATWRHALSTLPQQALLPANFKDDLQAIIRQAPLQRAESLAQSRQLYRGFQRSELRTRLADSIRSEMGRRVLDALEDDASTESK